MFSFHQVDVLSTVYENRPHLIHCDLMLEDSDMEIGDVTIYSRK